MASARVANFIKSHIIYRYGVPYELISDREAHFRAEVETLLQKYDIQHHKSFAYRPQTNGARKTANKNIKRLSKKLLFALWAYRTYFCTSTRAIPYSLVYDMEVVLLVEIEIKFFFMDGT